MLIKQILDRLADLGQEQLSAGLELASLQEQDHFLAQLNRYDSTLLEAQREALFSAPPSHPLLEPFSADQEVAEHPQGLQAIDAGKVGCLILAGGMGSRLGYPGPKGVAPVSLIKHKSLFQIFLEKTRAASRRAKRPLPLAILTSPLNHAQTHFYLESRQWFGLAADQVDLFNQDLLPLLDHRGNWLLEVPGRLAVGPDGNGSALKAFFRSGIWEKWVRLGVEYVNVVLIDNPLADPFDPHLWGSEAAVKGIPRIDPEEKVGVVVQREGKIGIVEYTELSDADRYAKDEKGALRWQIANAGLFCFSMDFIQRVASDPKIVLPYHLARKTAPVLLGTAQGFCTDVVSVWKCETFIFDLLPYAAHCRVLLCPREQTYAPLKTPSSLEEVRAALLRADRRVYAQLSGLPPPDAPFELDPSFYYPTPELVKRWKGHPLPELAYIEADV